MATRRPDFTKTLQQLIADVVARVPEFAHIQADRIVVVAGEARRASRGTIKPLAFRNGRSRDAAGRKKPTVRIAGKRMLYCITLRPLFFRDSTPHTRIGTVMHELFHIAPEFDGTLHAAHRHFTAGETFERSLRPLVKRYLSECPPELLRAFSYDGEVWMQQWLERPGVASPPGKAANRTLYTDKHLFRGIIRMITRPAKKKRRAPEDTRLQ